MKKNNLHNLKRIPEEGWIGGVAAGLSYFLKFPLWLMRLICILTFFLTMFWPMFFLYILLWFFMPAMDKTPEDFMEVVS